MRPRSGDMKNIRSGTNIGLGFPNGQGAQRSFVEVVWRGQTIILFKNSDAAIKQLLLTLNEDDQFVIEDLDETHLFVDGNSIERISERFEVALEENVYKLGDGVEVTNAW